MTAISAAAMRVRTMADGSLRIEVEVEPNDAQKAFALFGRPGAPMALAALAVGHAAKSDEPAQEQPKPERRRAPTTKPIAQWLAMRCAEMPFQAWVADQARATLPTEDLAADWCRTMCNVGSRGDIDGNPKAEALFKRNIQTPWHEHCTTTY
jgi:hypothetical protein